MAAGYAGTPLAKKLGIKPGFSILLAQQPAHYLDLFAEWPENTQMLDGPAPETADFIHLFCTTFQELEEMAPILKQALKKTGMLWVSWPKGTSDIPTDLKRDPIRNLLLDLGLVDAKVAAIDANWSALKFVYRLKDR